MDNEQNTLEGVVISDNTKGNNRHSAKTGRFIGKNGEEGTIDADLRKEILGEVIERQIKAGAFGKRVFLTYEKADDEGKKTLINAISYLLEKKAEEALKEKQYEDDRDVTSYTPASEIDTQGLNPHERRMALLQDTRLSKRALIDASDEEIEALLRAQYLYKTKNKDISNDPQVQALKNDQNSTIIGPWKSPMGLEDYEQLETTGRIDNKIYWFQNYYTGTDKDSIIQSIENYRALGKQYLEILKAKDLDTSADEAIMEKFSNPDNPYSWKRKHKDAFYNDTMSSSEDALLRSNQKFGAETNKLMKRIYKALGQDGMDIIADYTHGFTWAADPLREQYFSISGGSPIGARRASKWLDNIQLMTNVLNLCSYKDDMWVVRGTNYLGDPKHGINLRNISDINDLVGMTFADQGFVSTSGSKINYTNKTTEGSGFEKSNIIQHIYAPRGTHMLHVASLATPDMKNYFSSSDNSDYSRQNEFLLQRGYSYRITKAYQLNGQLHIDCEVILGSDEQKYDDNELKRIERTYVQ